MIRRKKGVKRNLKYVQNEANADVENELEVNGECVIMGMLKEKKLINNKERKIKGIISTILEPKKEDIGDHE